MALVIWFGGAFCTTPGLGRAREARERQRLIREQRVHPHNHLPNNVNDPLGYKSNKAVPGVRPVRSGVLVTNFCRAWMKRSLLYGFIWESQHVT